MHKKFNTNYEKKAEIPRRNSHAFIQKDMKNHYNFHRLSPSYSSSDYCGCMKLQPKIKYTSQRPPGSKHPHLWDCVCLFLLISPAVWVITIARASPPTLRIIKKDHVVGVWTWHQRIQITQTSTQVQTATFTWVGIEDLRFALSYWHKKPLGEKQWPVHCSQQQNWNRSGLTDGETELLGR